MSKSPKKTKKKPSKESKTTNSLVLLVQEEAKKSIAFLGSSQINSILAATVNPFPQIPQSYLTVNSELQRGMTR